ncbi:MAG: DUF5788 family protein [Halobacteriota archaeon]|nr:DUF5788 family protein [Halobacteriota archaeon]
MISEEDRNELIEKLKKSFSIVGREIPDEIYINGEELELSTIILNLIKKDELTEEDIKLKRYLKKLLIFKESNNEEKLKKEDLTEVEAEDLYDETLGIKRAILALEGIGKEREDIKDAYRGESIEDMKRWIGFLKRVK